MDLLFFIEYFCLVGYSLVFKTQTCVFSHIKGPKPTICFWGRHEVPVGYVLPASTHCTDNLVNTK